MKYIKEVKRQITELGAVRLQLNALIEIQYPNGETDTIHINSNRKELLTTDENEIKNAFEDLIQQINHKVETVDIKRSGGAFKATKKIRVMTTKYKPMRGSSYFELPDKIKRSQACINIKNEDNECFKYGVQCVVYDIINKDHPERMFHCKNRR